ARERIAQMREQEARRRRRRVWLAAAGAAVVAVGAAVGIVLAVTGGSAPAGGHGGTPRLKLASLSTLGTLRQAPPPGPIGPEGVPVPGAAPLAGTGTGAAGGSVDGIRCQTSEQTIFHTHAHLMVFMNGTPRQVP